MPAETELKMGLYEREIELRKQTEERHQKSIRQVVHDTIDEIRKAAGWKKISYNQVAKKNNISAQARALFLYALRSNENILTRQAAVAGGKNKDTSTAALEYKYVSKEEKEAAGLDCVFARRIGAEEKEAIGAALKEHDIKRSLVDVLGVIEYLIAQGGKDHWIACDTIQMVTTVGAPIKTIFETLDDLEKAQLLVRTERYLSDHARKRPICTITLTKEIYEKRRAEAENPDDIMIYKRPPKKYRIAKVGSDVKQITTEKERKQQSETLRGSEQSDASDLFNRINEAVKDVVDELVAERTKEKDNEIEQLRERLEALEKERAKDSMRFELMEKSVEQQKARSAGWLRFHNGFIANMQNQLTIGTGRLSTLIDEMTKLQAYQLKDPDLMNQYRGRGIEILTDIGRRIAEYKTEGYAPDLKK